MGKWNLELSAFSDEAGSAAALQIAALKRNGIFNSELRNVDGKNCAQMTAEEAKELRRIFDGEGIRVKTIGSPIGKVELSAPFEQEMERFLHLQENAQILGAEKMRIFSFFRTEGYTEEEGQKLALEHLNAFAEKAEMQLCHENEKDIYGDGWQFCRVISEQIPEIRAIFDPSNYIQCGVDTEEAWKHMRPFVEYLHLKDATKEGIVVPCGEGVGHVEDILRDYRADGGTFATIEPHLFSTRITPDMERIPGKYSRAVYETADEAFDAAVAAVRMLLDRVGV